MEPELNRFRIVVNTHRVVTFGAHFFVVLKISFIYLSATKKTFHNLHVVNFAVVDFQIGFVNFANNAIAAFTTSSDTFVVAIQFVDLNNILVCF